MAVHFLNLLLYICVYYLFVLSEDLMNFLIKGSLISKNIQGDNPLLKKLEKTFCLKLFSIQGTAQNRCALYVHICQYGLAIQKRGQKIREISLKQISWQYKRMDKFFYLKVKLVHWKSWRTEGAHTVWERIIIWRKLGGLAYNGPVIIQFHPIFRYVILLSG